MRIETRNFKQAAVAKRGAITSQLANKARYKVTISDGFIQWCQWHTRHVMHVHSGSHPKHSHRNLIIRITRYDHPQIFNWSTTDLIARNFFRDYIIVIIYYYRSINKLIVVEQSQKEIISYIKYCIYYSFRKKKYEIL